MSAPEFERVLGEHLPRDRYRDDGEAIGTYCTCDGWTGDYFADGEAGPFDAHLAAALNAEVARWLADEGTRERVAKAIHAESWHVMDHGRVECEDPSGCGATKEDDAWATAALAALASTADEGGAR